VSTPTIDRPLKPVADVFMFIEDKKADYKKKYPTMDDNELRRFMVKEFNCISDRDKVRLVVAFRGRCSRCGLSHFVSISSSTSRGDCRPASYIC